MSVKCMMNDLYPRIMVALKTATIYVLCLMLSACAANTLSTLDPTSLPQTATLVNKAANFYAVTDTLYRSQELGEADIALLETTGIKTVINLRYFNQTQDKILLAGKQYQLINAPLLTWSISPKQIAEVLWQIRLAEEKGKVLVHCYHGADRTGLIIAMYRIIYQGWDIDKAKLEMQQGGFGYHAVWRNIDGLFTPTKIAEIRAELAKLES